MKTLLLITAGTGRLDSAEYEKLQAEDKIPRATLFERRLSSDLLYDRFPPTVPGWRKSTYRFLPLKYAQILEAFFLRNKYDAIVSWGEHLTLPLALLLKIARARVPHVAIFSWIMKPKKALFLKHVHSHIDRLCIQSSAQREFAIHSLRVPEEKIVPLNWFVDTKFWRPMNVPPDMICASGREMRDYPTLLRAVWDTNIRCHIAAKIIPWKKDEWRDHMQEFNPLPPHITIGYDESLLDVRHYYARSRFIVLPLLPSDVEIGSTVLLEAMAMGKAVVCSKVSGQRDILRDGETGVFVPLGDVAAMKKAIVYLWENPAEAEKMGRAARTMVEERFGLDEWVERIRNVVAEEIEKKPRKLGRRH